MERLDRFFAAHGGKTVLLFRVIPTFRTMIKLPAGLMHVPTVKFLALTAVGTAIWNTVMIAAGYWLGHNFSQDRKSLVVGKSVYVRVDLGGHRIIKKKKYVNDLYYKYKSVY